MIKDFRFRFHLFDGEGASSGASDGLGAEARAFLGEEETETNSNSQTTYLYGSAAREEEVSEGPDGGGQIANNGKSLEDEFAELVGKGGKFHDIYGQTVSQRVQQRFKNQADLSQTVSRYDEALAPMYLKYGLKAGDIEGLQNAIAGDPDLYQAEAERQGLTPEQYRKNLQLQAEAERGRRISEEYEREKQRRVMYEDWDRQADELREAFPSFDLGLEIQTNDKFSSLIDAGVSIKDAFFACHAEDIISGARGEATKATQAEVVDRIQQRAQRPPENGVRRPAAVVRRVNPEEFTSEDIDRILAEVEAGKPFKL